jgi:hypothetical protein
MLFATQPVLRYTQLARLLYRTIDHQEARIDVMADFGYYKGQVSLCLTKRAEAGEDPAVVHIVAGPGNGELTVAYFSNRSIINDTFDPYGFKKAKGEVGFAQEYHHILNTNTIGHEDERAVIELTCHLVHFFWKGAVMEASVMSTTYPSMHHSLADIVEPKLR